MDKPLRSLCLNATNRCINRCTYCFTNPNNTDMSIDTAKQALLFLKQQSDGQDVSVNWFGGEPMMMFHNLIVPIMEWTKEQEMPIKWGISTNGELLDEEALTFFKKHNCNILFSIDGDEYTQNDHRPLANGDPTWPLIKDKLSMFGQYPDSLFRSTVTARNVDKIAAGYEVARENSFTQYYCGLVFEDPDWTQEKFDIFLEQAFIISSIMYQDFKDYGRCMVIRPLISAIKEKLMNSDIVFSDNHCGLGTRSCGVSPEGYLVGCQEHSTLDMENDIFVIGDVFNGFDPVRKEKLLSFYKKAFDNQRKESKCQQCKFYKNCFPNNCPSLLLRSKMELGKPIPSFCAWRDVWEKCATLIMAKAAIENNKEFLRFLNRVILGEEEL